MKKVRFALALARALTAFHVQAISLDDIQLWTGSGTNRAALVIEWNAPEIINNGNTVPAPVANKTMVWGYRFNGIATGTQMFNAVVAANPNLYAVVAIDPELGTEVQAIGFNLDGTGRAGVTDGTLIVNARAFTNGVFVNTGLNVDGTLALNRGDLFWSGFDGPYWQLWNELGDAGGFLNSPNRGSNPFWDGLSAQGEWASSYSGLDGLVLTNGSWIGFSVSADGYPLDATDPNYAADLAVFNNDEQAPPSPAGTYTVYVANTNDFAVQVVSASDLDSASPYNDPAAVLDRPTLQFYDSWVGGDYRVSVINPAFNVAPNGSNVLAEIKNGGQITVKLGRKVCADPDHPYGVDLMVYGYSFFSDFTTYSTNLSAATLAGSKIFGHATVVSVSQDGTNWVALPAVGALFPENAYRWDDASMAWTDEAQNPTKPLNPFLYTNDFAGQTVAGILDAFGGAEGGTGYSLSGSGLPWIQYVQIQPGGGDYTVIDALAAAAPAVVGDALVMAPDNLTAGIGRLAFQNPGDRTQNQIAINFDSLADFARASTVSLGDFSSFAPVVGSVSSAYQIQWRPLMGTNAVAFQAEVGLRAGSTYAGNGNDLRVWQWQGTHWASQPFSYTATNQTAWLTGVTNFSAFVLSQIVPPRLNVQPLTNGFAFQFTPVPNGAHVLERSTDLITWSPVFTNVPAGPAPLVWQDTNAPADKAFYRLRVEVP